MCVCVCVCLSVCVMKTSPPARLRGKSPLRDLFTVPERSVHSEGYIQVHTKMTKIQSTKERTKGKNKPEHNPTMIYPDKQVSTIYEGVLLEVALLRRLGNLGLYRPNSAPFWGHTIHR